MHISNHRGYHCFDLATCCVLTFRHVTLDEHQFPFCAASSYSSVTPSERYCSSSSNRICRSSTTCSSVGFYINATNRHSGVICLCCHPSIPRDCHPYDISFSAARRFLLTVCPVVRLHSFTSACASDGHPRPCWHIQAQSSVRASH